MIVTPLLLYKLMPPGIKETPDAPAAAAKRLEAMGPMGRDETIMAVVMGAALVMWMFGETLGISPVLAAMLGLCGLLCTGVLTWRECLSYTPAWDTLCWFAVLIGMSGQLNSMVRRGVGGRVCRGGHREGPGAHALGPRTLRLEG